jgi:hypothetical protein
MNAKAPMQPIRPDEEWHEKTSTGPIDVIYGPLVKDLGPADAMILRRNANDPNKLILLSWPLWQRVAATVKAHWGADACAR